MKSYSSLPEGYSQCMKLDLQNDKRTALLVNAACIFIMAVMLALGHLVYPLDAFLFSKDSVGLMLLRFLIILAGNIAYIVLHEAIHGIFMKLFSDVKVNYGFTGMYAFAGSSAYFTKMPYIVIALSPIVIFGVLFAVLCFIVPPTWFWVPYFLQIMNVSGAAGDLYVTYKFTKLPSDILVNDTGVCMTVYSKNQ